MAAETLERNFTVPIPARLVVENIRGSVHVQPGEAGQISVKAVKHSGSGDANRTKVEMTQDEDGSVRVRTRFQETGWLTFSPRRACKVDYTILVPPSCSVNTSSVSAAVDLHGIEGQVQVATVSGAQTLKDLSGSLDLNTVSGCVRGEALSGQLQLETVSGNVRFEECSFSSLRGATVSGDLSFETSLSDGPYRFNAISGNVRLVVPPGTGCRVRTSTMSGRFNTSLAITGSRSQGGKRSFDLESGGPQVDCTSVSGDLILIHQGSGEEQAEQDARPHRRDPEARLHLLDRIARREISVEEGLQELT